MKSLLVTVLIGLSVLLVMQWRDWPPDRMGSRPDTPREVAPPIGEKGDNPLAQLPPPLEKQDYVSVTERPLFLPGRRPPEETPEAEDPEGVPGEGEPLTALDAMDLNAVIITPDGAVAWVSTPNSPKPQKVRIGDEFEGWKVKAITPDNVEVQGVASTDSLILRNYSQGGQPPPNRPPARAAAKPGGAAAKPNGRPPRQASPPTPRPPTQPNGVKPQRPPRAAPK